MNVSGGPVARSLINQGAFYVFFHTHSQILNFVPLDFFFSNTECFKFIWDFNGNIHAIFPNLDLISVILMPSTVLFMVLLARQALWQEG